MRDMQPVELEMFLDVSCPWCHGALGTNRRVLDEFAADPALPPLAITWRFQRLHPMPAAEGISVTSLHAGYAKGDPDAAAAMLQSAFDYVESVGARIDSERYTWVHDPETAHRLLAIVRDDGGHDLPDLWSLARVVWSANFVGGIDITDPAALRRAVEDGGLQLPERIWSLLEQPDGHLAVTLADHDRALEVGLDGVPRIVVGGTIVPTWVDPSEVRASLRAAISSAG
ncbi:MAG: 2-hydroxychromene-2-carboxylate isomerase/DsbA-like thioredoxin domain protein [Thermoleophilia bacterium]|nr:2-hydroxychromene-2-carboxylate isomerase/DsbA-like thioredoxin domain protein [Thermoleophilia bacterium]MCZ4497098.1 2-hydroxychromene-2-carboxylate isomerase/DsbA-like thioredoxin domain protein [Thermoleophilia bacterium]